MLELALPNTHALAVMALIIVALVLFTLSDSACNSTFQAWTEADSSSGNSGLNPTIR